MCPNICTFPHLVVLRGGVTQFPYAMIVYALGRLHCPNLLMLALALTGGAHPVAVVVEVLSKIVSQLLTVVGEINFGLKTGSDSSIQFLRCGQPTCAAAPSAQYQCIPRPAPYLPSPSSPSPTLPCASWRCRRRGRTPQQSSPPGSGRHEISKGVLGRPKIILFGFDNIFLRQFFLSYHNWRKLLWSWRWNGSVEVCFLVLDFFLVFFCFFWGVT
jgi:hypothetical protein